MGAVLTDAEWQRVVAEIKPLADLQSEMLSDSRCCDGAFFVWFSKSLVTRWCKQHGAESCISLEPPHDSNNLPGLPRPEP